MDKVSNIVMDSIMEINTNLTSKIPVEKEHSQIFLFGTDGVLDSLGLVTLILRIEEKIEESFDVSITLANDKAFSQKNSPFRTVAALIDYVHASIFEEKAHV